jgi:hypothetical protein
MAAGMSVPELNLGDGLSMLGGRERRPLRAWDMCLTAVDAAWPPKWVQDVRSRRDKRQNASPEFRQLPLWEV